MFFWASDFFQAVAHGEGDAAPESAVLAFSDRHLQAADRALGPGDFFIGVAGAEGHAFLGHFGGGAAAFSAFHVLDGREERNKRVDLYITLELIFGNFEKGF
jgi:hypothetical protein